MMILTRREQKISNPLLDRIRMPTLPALQLATRNTRLHEQRVQILHRLRGLAILCRQSL